MNDTERTQQAETKDETVVNEGRRLFARKALLGLAAAGAAIAVAPRSAQAGSSSDNWKMEGNGNVDSGDFIGTTNAQPLRVKTNGKQRMTVHSSGDVSVGASSAVESRLYVKGETDLALSAYGVGVRGDTWSGSKFAAGVEGRLAGYNEANATPPAGVRGMVTDPINTQGAGVAGIHAGKGRGVVARNNSSSFWSPALDAMNLSTTGRAVAIYADVRSTDPLSQAIFASAEAGIGIGGYSDTSIGVHGDGKTGVLATTYSSAGVALEAISYSGTALAGKFTGSVKITGNLHLTGSVVKAAAALTTMDHPLDPENHTLSMAGVESPELKSVYDGVAAFDERGRAVVELPAYVTALNADFRYQLTALGGAMPHLHVAEEIADGRFTIGGGRPGKRVSWQVTGVRVDAVAMATPLVVEAAKPEAERGTYLNPAAYGMPEERGTGYQSTQERMVVKPTREEGDAPEASMMALPQMVEPPTE